MAEKIIAPNTEIQGVRVHVQLTTLYVKCVLLNCILSKL